MCILYGKTEIYFKKLVRAVGFRGLAPLKSTGQAFGLEMLANITVAIMSPKATHLGQNFYVAI